MDPQHIPPEGAIAAHSGAVAAVLASWAGWLPPLFATLASIGALCWWLLCIYESKTFQAWLARRRGL